MTGRIRRKSAQNVSYRRMLDSSDDDEESGAPQHVDEKTVKSEDDEDEDEIMPRKRRQRRNANYAVADGQSDDENDEDDEEYEDVKSKTSGVSRKKSSGVAKKSKPRRRTRMDRYDDDFVVPDDEYDEEADYVDQSRQNDEDYEDEGDVDGGDDDDDDDDGDFYGRKSRKAKRTKRRKPMKRLSDELGGDEESDEEAVSPVRSSSKRRKNWSSSAKKSARRASAVKFVVGRDKVSDDEFGAGDEMDDFIVPDDEVDELDEEDEEDSEDGEEPSKEPEIRRFHRASVLEDDDDEEDEGPTRPQEDSSDEEDMVIHKNKRPSRMESESSTQDSGRGKKKRRKRRARREEDGENEGEEPFSHAALFQRMLQQDEEEKSRKAAVASVKLEEAFVQYVRVLATAGLGGMRALRKMHKRDRDVGNGFLRGCYNKMESHICTTRESRIGSGAWGAKRQHVLNDVSQLSYLSYSQLDEATRHNMCDYRCDLCGRKEGARSQGVSFEIKFSGFPYDGKGVWEPRAWETWPEYLNPMAGALPEHKDEYLAGLAKKRSEWDRSVASHHIESYMTAGDSRASNSDNPIRQQSKRAPIIDISDESDEGDNPLNNRRSTVGGGSNSELFFQGGVDEGETDAVNVDEDDDDEEQDDDIAFKTVTVYVGKTCRDRIWRYHNLIHYKFRLLLRIKKFADQVNAQDVDEFIAHDDFIESEWDKLTKYIEGAISLDGGLQEREEYESGLGNMQSFLHRNERHRSRQAAPEYEVHAAEGSIAESDDNDSGEGQNLKADSDEDDDVEEVHETRRQAQLQKTPASKLEDVKTTSTVSQDSRRFSTSHLSARRGYKLESRIGGRFSDPLGKKEGKNGESAKKPSGSRRARQMVTGGSASRRRSAPDIIQMLRNQTNVE